MKIEPFNRGLGDFSVKEDLKNNKFHMVFVAVNALTFFNAFAVVDPSTETEKGISLEQATRLCEIVNEKNETGTLFPKLNITILPLSRYNGRDDWDNEERMKKNIKDAFLANSLYIKSRVLIFAFEARFDFNNELAVKVLEKVANEYNDDGILKKVYFIWG
jgi:hypothetical protein